MRVGTCTLDCSQTTAINVSSEGRPGALSSASVPETAAGESGGVCNERVVAIGIILVELMTEDVRSAIKATSSLETSVRMNSRRAGS